MTTLVTSRSAVISECGTYRYELRRVWNSKRPLLGVCGLNPSTADGRDDDPTVRKWIGFSTRLGFGGFVAVNEFGFRTKSVKILREIIDGCGSAVAVGPDNDRFIIKIAKEVKTFVVCWGSHGYLENRDHAVKKLLEENGVRAKCWGLTTQGLPKHPARLAYATPLERWEMR